jgi:polar amino acid transport system substrate-binding protein
MTDPTSAEIAPNGKLRAATIRVRVMRGIAEPLGAHIAERLGAAFDFTVFPNPRAYEQSFAAPAWDVAIGPRLLAPADKADLTADVWLVDLNYFATAAQTFASAGEVDRPGVRVGTIENSPSDRFLTRTLKSATLVRLPLSENFPMDAIALLRDGGADAFGADCELIAAIAGGYPDGRTVPGAFTTVRAAVALPKGRSAAAQARLAALVKAAKDSGVVQQAIERAGLTHGVRVAPD